jgi:hypothetical protein
VFFQLIFAIVWWLFQIIPMLHAYQDSQGNWIRRRTCVVNRASSIRTQLLFQTRFWDWKIYPLPQQRNTGSRIC